ncbi:MAG: bifunctional chorismate mutase/prephenate dehydratase [Bacteroidetes bacterium]|nr:bifunctional chorismate mutase/prephenate dehydratase [Bacteroidota bacterium]
MEFSLLQGYFYRMISQQPRVVFFQGEPGAYSDLAASRMLPGIPRQGFLQFSQAFEALLQETGPAAGVFPIENSIYGSVHPVFDLLQTYDFHITGEFRLRIEHCLLANSGASAETVKTVYSHPQALGQCEVFFRNHPSMKPVQWYDTAGSARYVSENPADLSIAAIASEEAARVYGLEVLKRNIESFDHNFTRFILIGKEAGIPAGSNKTSVWFEAKDEPGSLYHCIGCFASRNINLLKIESRPVWGKPWKHLFYLDIRGTVTDSSVQEALRQLTGFTEVQRVLGSYPEDQVKEGHGFSL